MLARSTRHALALFGGAVGKSVVPSPNCKRKISRGTFGSFTESFAPTRAQHQFVGTRQEQECLSFKDHPCCSASDAVIVCQSRSSQAIGQYAVQQTSWYDMWIAHAIQMHYQMHRTPSRLLRRCSRPPRRIAMMACTLLADA